MADFLLKAKGTWMDSLTEEEVNEKGLVAAYASRNRKGDVIEVGPDGKWPDHAHGNGAFIIARAPFISEEDAKKYSRPSGAYKRRYYVDIDSIPVDRFKGNTLYVKDIEELKHYGIDKVTEWPS